MIYGIVKCQGNESPQFFDYIRDFYPTANIFWYEIYPPVSNFDYLSYINRGIEDAWAAEVASKYSKMHHGVYIIIQDGKGGEIKTIKEKLKFTHNGGTQWHFDAQREIQDGAKLNGNV